MKLRKLKEIDAPYMLEWMHDADVTQNLQANFAEKDISDCMAFIRANQAVEDNLNLAIVNSCDEYMGTVSLKHIDPVNKSAEFAISTRSCAMGQGYAAYGMAEIIRIALQELDLDRVYWCVSPKNKRAVRFYDKNNYLRIDYPPAEAVGYTEEQMGEFVWYEVKK